MISEYEKKEQIRLYLQGGPMPSEIWETLDKKEKKRLYKLQKKNNFDKASKEIDKIFEENNIERETYSKIYGINLNQAIHQLRLKKFSKLFLVTKEERSKILLGFYKQKGLNDKWDYQIKYRRTEKQLDKRLLELEVKTSMLMLILLLMKKMKFLLKKKYYQQQEREFLKEEQQEFHILRLELLHL